ncbi:hypothetical protein ACIBG8_22805 [Nonomuraea sp. NPDC050556]|uniref:hypothetical protein n=1 Tax=Nonomuraea sp. NPDC050556 TaxID=3364369 RepID=UPI00379D95DA
MTEYVGIHPEGARALITAMNRARNLVSDSFLAELKQQLGVAQSDAVLEAQASYAVYQQYRTFLDTYTRDLQWRIEVITGSPGATVQGEMIYGNVEFANAKQAAEQGKKDCEEFTAIWEKAEQTGDYGPVFAYMDSHQKQLTDPEYAAAFLKALGKENLKNLLDKLTVLYAPEAYGLSPEQLEAFKKGMGPLANAIKAANDPEINDYITANCSFDALSALIESADFSDDFVAAAIVTMAPHLSSSTTVNDWNSDRIMAILAGNPEVLARVLADEKGAEMLLRESLMADPAYRDAITKALDKALDQTTDSPTVLSQAWANVLKVGSQDYFQDIMAKDHDLAQMLTDNFVPFLEYAGYLQVVATGDTDLLKKMQPPGGPFLPKTVDPKTIADFLGAAVRHPDLAETLGKKAQEISEKNGLYTYMKERGVDGVTGDPVFVQKLATEFALTSLLLGAYQSADLDELQDDQDRKATYNALFGFTLGIFTGPAGTLGGSAIGTAAAPWIDKLAEAAAGKTKGVDPAKQMEAAKEAFMQQFGATLTELGGGSLSEDQRNAIMELAVGKFESMYREAMMNQY